MASTLEEEEQQWRQDLTEPLLPSSGEEVVEEQALTTTTTTTTTTRAENGNEDDNSRNNQDNDDAPCSSSSSSSSSFSWKTEIFEMMQLGIPLAVSFFCRMGMASTDSSFVGHIHDDTHTPEIYLAAAVLSDMVVNVCITPPLAFNQVLNALVGQAMGSGNPKMAGIWLQQSMFWLSVTMLPCLVGLWFVEPILLLLGFPQDVSQVAGVYAKFNLLWPIPNGIYQCMRFYFQAQGLPRPAMYNNIFFLFVNAFLNWMFVFGGPIPHWNGFGFVGAAISLSISRTMQGVVYFLYMFVYKKHHRNTWPDAGWSFCHHTKDRTLEFMKQALPNIGTLLFQCCASQATTVLVGRLGELSIAASSALSTVTIPWSGTLSATTCTVSGVRVGYHLGRGDAYAAKRSAWLVIHFITAVNVLMVFFFIPLQNDILQVATDDTDVWRMAATLVPAMLLGTYLNLVVSNITSGVFSGMGRPLIATILSFGFELPMSIGGVAIYILYYHGHLLGVYWWQAISGGIEAAVVLVIFMLSDWDKCAEEARARQEAPGNDSGEEVIVEDGATTDPESVVTSTVESSSEDGDDPLEGEESSSREESLV